jgi:LuxR family maltose regulon positive regulatory protein
VLSGRCPSGLALARLRVAGELADIGAADLACTAPEADAYLAMLGLSLAPAQRDGLLHRTEGWMAGLRLAAMAQRPAAGASDCGPGAAAGGGARAKAGAGTEAGAGLGAGTGLGAGGNGRAGATEAVVIDYVCDEVLGRQSPETRVFMLRTSVAASVCGDLADALTGGGRAGARTLERLVRENSLVEPVGSGNAEYRYHPMLREVLAVELRRELPQEVPALLRRAARWHAAHGQAIDAVRTAAEAEDWEFGAHVLAQAGAGILADPAELEAVLAAFPPDHRADDVPVAAALAAARLWQGDTAGAAPHLACAQRSLPRLDPPARRAVEPWLTALRVLAGASQADWPGNLAPDWLALEWSQAEQASADAAAVPEYRAAGALWFALGCARLRRFEIGSARDAFARATSQLAAGSLPGLRARAIAWHALAAARYGDLAAAQAMLAEVSGGPAEWRAAAARPLALAGAQVSLARDELDTARVLADAADRCPGRQLAGEPRVAIVSGLIRAHCATAESDTAAAHSIVMRLREASLADDPALGRVLTLLEADLALAAGERDRASHILSHASLPYVSDVPPASAPSGPEVPPRGPAVPSGPAMWHTSQTPDGAWSMFDPAALRPRRADAQLCHARLLLATGDDKGALQTAEASLDGSAEDATLRDRVAALLIAAVAQRRLSQVTEAAASIEQALVLAEPDGAYRMFLDGGPALRSAMTVLVPPTSRCAGFAGRILERFDGQLPRAACAADQADLPLTSSELAVLRFLPSHMTNQEIAEALFLSINTVKTHLRSAYRKLGVSNRRHAIARGRRLDLL